MPYYNFNYDHDYYSDCDLNKCNYCTYCNYKCDNYNCDYYDYDYN